ncbi:hypothetical protein ACJX0J_029117 [Zea mays]
MQPVWSKENGRKLGTCSRKIQIPDIALIKSGDCCEGREQISPLQEWSLLRKMPLFYICVLRRIFADYFAVYFIYYIYLRASLLTSILKLLIIHYYKNNLKGKHAASTEIGMPILMVFMVFEINNILLVLHIQEGFSAFLHTH